jgi:hypothetical protein
MPRGIHSGVVSPGLEPALALLGALTSLGFQSPPL